MKKYWATFNYLEFELPAEAIKDCHHQGAWSGDELKALDDDELEQKIIWIAAGNIQDDKDHEYNNENEGE